MLYESWTMSLNVNLKPQKQEVILIMDKFVTHCLEPIGNPKSFGFFNLTIEQYYYCFLTI